MQPNTISLSQEQAERVALLQSSRDNLNPAQGCNVILYFCSEGETPSLDNTFAIIINRSESSGVGLGNVGGLENFKKRAAGQRETPEQTVQRETIEELGDVGVTLIFEEKGKDQLELLFQANDDTNYVMKGGKYAPVDAYVFSYRLSESELDQIFPGAVKTIKEGKTSTLVRQGLKQRPHDEVHSIQLKSLRETIATADFSAKDEAHIFRYAHELLGHIRLAQDLGIDVLGDDSIRIDWDAIITPPLTWHLPHEEAVSYVVALLVPNEKERKAYEEKLITYREARRAEGLINPGRYVGGTRFANVKVDPDLAQPEKGIVR